MLKLVLNTNQSINQSKCRLHIGNSIILMHFQTLCLLTSNLSGSRPTFAVGSSSEGIFQLNDHYQRIDLDLGNMSKDVISLDVNMKSGDIYFFTKKVIM